MESAAEELRRVGAGLRLVSLGLATLAVNAVAALVVALTLVKPEPNPDLAAMLARLNREHPAAMTVLLGLGVLAHVLGIAGKVFCLSIPAASGAVPFIRTAVACTAIGLSLSFAGQAGGADASSAVLVQIGSIFTTVGLVFFLRFLSRLAAYLGSARLLAKTQRVQAGLLVLFLLFFGTMLAQSAVGIGPAIVVVALVLVLGVVILYGMYTRLVVDIRRTTEAAVDYVTEQGTE